MNTYRIMAIIAAAFCLAPLAQADEFHQLPRTTRVCAAGDMIGLFKLRNVWEKPKNGEAVQDFQRAPHQYLFFRKTQSYVEVAGSRNYTDPKAMDQELTKRFTQDKRQYVLAESGALYFYKGGKPTDTYVCDIVTKAEPPYRQNEMLLIAITPATGAVAVKAYARYNFQSAPPIQPARLPPLPNLPPLPKGQGQHPGR